MKAAAIRSFLGALTCALTVTAAHAQVVPDTKMTANTAALVKAKEGMVKLADSSIQYFSRGEGETIVLLPGGTLTVGYLDGVAEVLAKSGYRVVGINFRGSGKSTGSSKGVTLQNERG